MNAQNTHTHAHTKRKEKAADNLSLPIRRMRYPTIHHAFQLAKLAVSMWVDAAKQIRLSDSPMENKTAEDYSISQGKEDEEREETD